jgi:16S rRNA (adenine1518-N6/adenine1519-N6)-dimethyltransferase
VNEGPRGPRDARRGPPALKRLGQNFLKDPAILARIADALQLAPSECVIEIGAGKGALTAQLAARARRVIAVEIDKALVPMLRERFAAQSNVEIVEGDALSLPLGELAGEPFTLTGNVPYYITTPLIFHALTPPRPERAVFLVQKEVAERAAAPPGSRVYGALSVNLQAMVKVEVLFAVPPGAFIPRPAVDSAVIRLRPLATPLIPAEDEESFRRFVLQLFGGRRKQVQRILRSSTSLGMEDATALVRSCGLDPAARPETLAPADIVRLHAAQRPFSALR